MLKKFTKYCIAVGYVILLIFGYTAIARYFGAYGPLNLSRDALDKRAK
jgi:hypothetical protein